MTRTPEQHHRLALVIGRCELAGIRYAQSVIDAQVRARGEGTLMTLHGPALDAWLEQLEWLAGEAEAAQLGYQLDQGRRG